MKKMLGVLAVTILGASLSFAQTPDNANSDRGTTQNDNRGFDWGWLGLLGLAGLGGLRGRARDTASQRDRDVSNIRRAA